MSRYSACKQDRYCTNNVTLRALAKPLLPLKINITDFFVCVCARARVGACVGGRVGVSMCVGAYSLTCPACTILSFTASLVPPYFSTLSHKRHEFRGNVYEHKMCFDFLNNFCLKHSHSKKMQRDIVIKVKTSPCNVPVIRVRF